MGQTFGILGFAFGLLAIFFASEVMRRAGVHQAEVVLALHKARARILKLEHRMGRLERLNETTQHQKKRQGETITALAQQSEKEAKRDVDGRAHDRFTPSSHKQDKARKTG